MPSSVLPVVCMATLAGADTPGPPNVVIILADDQGWGDLSINGNRTLSTPRIDSLAREGACFERFYVCPVCSPTRAELLTGRWHPRCGVVGVSEGGERLDLGERTIADAFRAAGHATGIFGKWHNGSQYPYHPRGRGFDTFYGFTSGHWGTYFDAPVEHDGVETVAPGYLADALTGQALRFIETNRERPFLCYLPLNTPHSPMQVPDRDFARFAGRDPVQMVKGENPAFTRAALAMCENIDANVGRVLDRLDALGLAERTIVVYFSDNGPNKPRWNGGLRGIKSSTDEGGVRSACHIRWLGRIPAGTVVAPIAGAIDLLPTLASLAGVPLAGHRPLDGLDLAPLLRGTVRTMPDRRIFSTWNGKVSVRTQRWRLDAQGRLYDMDADPGQERDVAADHDAVAGELRAAVAEWRRSVLPAQPPADRPHPVGHREWPATILPARDGKPHGGVQRSAKAPNCSYFTGWTGVGGFMSWEVEVATAGRYRVALRYACPAADAGSTIVLSAGAARCEALVDQAHDPPLVGAAQDRVPREGESYVKDFALMPIGTITLPAGRQRLELRALRIPGRQVCEVRSLHLTLEP